MNRVATQGIARVSTIFRGFILGRVMLATMFSLIVLAANVGFTQRLACRADRLTKNPVITPQLFVAAGVPADGHNINGPSLIRVPDWVSQSKRPDPSAQYYLYFAHHGGRYIRMAWAAKVEGPYQLYEPGTGVLTLQQPRAIHPSPDRWAVPLADDLAVEGHIASPDVIVDDANRRFIMFYHGFEARPSNGGGASSRFTGPDGKVWQRKKQRAFVSLSDDGLDFNGNTLPRVAGTMYLRTFQVDDAWYSSSYHVLRRAADPADPLSGWEEVGKHRSLSRARHTAVRVGDDGTITVFFSRKGDSPEHILYATIRGFAKKRTNRWQVHGPKTVVYPETDWEGGDLPITKSREGASHESVRQLQDPAYFCDKDGSEYLLYAVAGEKGIAIARLTWFEP